MRTLDQAIVGLIDKCLERRWRVQVASPSMDRLKALNAGLWTLEPSSFIPHGLATDPGADAEPVVLAETALPILNRADVALLLDGARLSVTDAPTLSRCLWVFEDGDTPTRDAARAGFKAARGAGLKTRYYIEAEKGGWQEQTV
jgi:DNA polymerase-3 subunit chi